MNNSQKYVIFYSEQCQHSKDFMNQLYKNYDLYKKFMKINVDKVAKIPKMITVVPTIIVPGIPKPLSDNTAFMWLKSINSNNNMNNGRNDTMNGGNISGNNVGNNMGNNMGNNGIESFDPIAMSGFSDSFSSLDNGNPLDKNFSFVGRSNTDMITPPDDNQMNSNKVKTDSSSRIMEDLKMQRDREVAGPVQRS